MTDNVIPLRDFQKNQSDIEKALSRLKDGDGGGTFDGMEARVAKLESHMEHVVKSVDRLADVPTELAVVKATMATKGWLVTGLLLSLTAIAALTAFAEKIQALVN